MRRQKRKMEILTGIISIFLVVAVVSTWLYLVVMEQRDPPQVLALLAVLGVAGAITSTYKIEDIKRLLEFIRGR